MVLPASSQAGLRAAAAILESGGIVAFPTETVYGLAVRVSDAGAHRKLQRLKGRSANKPFQILLSSKRVATTLCGRMPAIAQRFAHACWPGPLTIVVRDKNGQWQGLRLPDHQVARSLARRVGGAVVATSANVSGSRPAGMAKQVLDGVRGVDLVLDGGRVRIGKPSSVVRVQEDGWEMLREGAIDRQALVRVVGTQPSVKRRIS